MAWAGTGSASGAGRVEARPDSKCSGVSNPVPIEFGTARRHGTVKGADELAVTPFNVQVTMCVPVPGLVVESVA